MPDLLNRQIARRWRSIPLRWLILCSYLALLSLTWGTLSVGLRVMMGRYLHTAREMRLLVAAQAGWFRHDTDEKLHRQATFWLPATDEYPGSSPGLAQRMCSRGTYVRILSGAGQLLAEQGESKNPPPVDLTRLELLRKQVQQSPARFQSYRYPNDLWQVLLIPVLRDGQLVGVIQMCSDYSDDARLLSALERYLLLSATIGAGLALLLTRWLASVLAKPMVMVLAATRKVRAGDFSARTGVPEGRNEMYAVAAAFDAMVDQVQQTFVSQKRFVADASHELKTPLTAIGGMAEVLSVGSPEQVRVAIATIEKEAERMDRLVTDLLTLSRAEHSLLIAKQELDLAELLQETVEGIRACYPQRECRLETAKPLMVSGNAHLLSRVIRNLLENAVQYSPGNGLVCVTGWVEEGWVNVAVADRGSGILADDLSKVFDRFYRADRSRARTTGGTGLGLSIVKSLLLQHGGRIEVHSVPDQGSTFTFFLPAVAA